MRTVTIDIAGESIHAPVTFTAGSALAKAGFDPLATATRANRGEFSPSSLDVVMMIYIGVHAAGSKLSLEQVGDAIYEAGVNAYMGVALEYLSAFVTAEPEHPVSGEAQAA